MHQAISRSALSMKHRCADSPLGKVSSRWSSWTLSRVHILVIKTLLCTHTHTHPVCGHLYHRLSCLWCPLGGYRFDSCEVTASAQFSSLVNKPCVIAVFTSFCCCCCIVVSTNSKSLKHNLISTNYHDNLDWIVFEILVSTSHLCFCNLGSHMPCACP
jgi:hypothetical protein